MSDLNCGVYQIVSPSGKRYIGSSNDIRRRWNNHRSILKKNKHHSPILQNSVNKHGLDKFKFEVLVYCPEEDLFVEEQRAFEAYSPEFNIAPIAGSPRGIKRTEAFKDNLRKLMTGNTYMVGLKLSDETKERVSKSLIGNQRAVGKQKNPRSEEHRQKLRQAGMGHKVSSETRLKISEAFRLKREAKLNVSL